MTVVLIFGASGALKVRSPEAIEAFISEFSWMRVSARLMAMLVAAVELLAAVGMLRGQRWAFVLAAALVLVSSVAIVSVLRRGARPRCGCLGDLSVTRVGRLHLARNAAILGAVILGGIGPTERPSAALLSAAALAYLMLTVPESLEMVSEFRKNVRGEVRAVIEGRSRIA